MAERVSIDIEAQDKSQGAFRQVDQSLKSLEQQTRAVQSSTRQSAAALGLFDDEAKKAAIGVTSLGRYVFNTSDEARKFGGVFRGVDGRLRESNGRFVKGREVVDQLGRSFQRTGKNAGLLGRGLTRASGGANILTRSVGSLGGVLGALGIAAVTHEIGRFGITSVQTAGQLEQGGNQAREAAGEFDVLGRQIFKTKADVTSLLWKGCFAWVFPLFLRIAARTYS